MTVSDPHFKPEDGVDLEHADWVFCRLYRKDWKIRIMDGG
jgi:hypothetical protein